ncbi:hypothetical protein ASF88_18975 [Leifsonia sp. Leaf336]|nr:hypothetical protein ASF88_18975 [Leifsonia sp. Leaf336]
MHELVGIDTSGYADQQVTFGFAAGISGMDAGRDVANKFPELASSIERRDVADAERWASVL